MLSTTRTTRRQAALFGSTALTRGRRWALCGLAGSLAVGLASAAQALPTGGVTSAGSASISGGQGALTVNQSSQSAIINWQGFSIGQGEAVNFVQPDSQSVALNRVLGADPSSILGSLSANGKVFLVNPNGILFAPGARVNAGGLVASTLGITDARFLAGDYRFSGGGGGVLNQGVINADGGYVALIGATVDNQGVISARLGTVALAAGSAVTLDVAGDGLLSVVVNEGAVDALARNGGLIAAGGGQVLMTAASAGQLIRTAVNNTGVIEAQSLQNRNGVISLSGGPSGLVEVGGVLDASGTASGQTGGAVTVTGAHVGLFGARIDASGDAGGGVVLIGGDFHGTNAAVPNAMATYMSADSVITADAINMGAGGKVALWSDGSTRASGAISARGGAEAGDGGLIETSGHWLDVTGARVTAGATNGLQGGWLLDPADVTIGSGNINGGFINNVFTPNSGVGAATVDAGALQAALNGGTNVTITTANNGVSGSGLGDITVASALTWTTGRTLTLLADHDVIVNAGAAITASTQNSQLVIVAQHDIDIRAALVASAQDSKILLTAGNDILATAAVTATGLGAVIDMGAGHDISAVAITADGGGSVTSINLHANNDVVLNGAVNAAGGLIMLRSDSDGSGPGALAGTVRFAGVGLVGSSAATAIRFNPAGYANTATEISNYTAKVTGTLDARAWAFPLGVDKPYDGTTAAALQFRNPLGDNPNVGNTVTLNGGVADFDTKNVGLLKSVAFSGYTIGGGDLARFALYSPIGVASGSGLTTAAVTPIPLVITANSHAPKLYGANVAMTGAEYASIGLISGEAIGGVSLASAGFAPAATVGTYAIIPSGAAANGAFAPANYTISYVNGALPVVGRPLTITADSATKLGGTTLTFDGSAFTSLGLQNGETIGSVQETSLGAVASSAPGDYVIVVSGAAGGSFDIGNYVPTYVPGTLAVSPAATVVTPNNPTVTPPVTTPTDAPPVVAGTPPVTTPTGTPPVVAGAPPITVGETPGVVLAPVLADLADESLPIDYNRAIRGDDAARFVPVGLPLAVLGGGVAMPIDSAAPRPFAAAHVAAPEEPAAALLPEPQAAQPQPIPRAAAPAVRPPLIRAPKQDRH